jgi:hypothetical protein
VARCRFSFTGFAGFPAVVRLPVAELFSARIERRYAMAFCYAGLCNALVRLSLLGYRARRDSSEKLK